MKKKRKVYLLFLLSGSFCLFLGSSFLDPFINMWDEQYHALVAKNLSHHFFHPTLYENTPLPYDYTLWIGNHTWVHKQPLYLWQIAVSMKIFGYNEFALRFPSVLMATITVFFVLQIGTWLKNERTGFIAALFLSMNYFLFNLVSGYFHTDHNDVAFVFYITASVWAYMKYRQTGKLKYALLTGAFSGCAILVKWLTGLLIFSGWGISILFRKDRLRNILEYRNIILALITCVVIFLPWQIYISTVFPTESAHEYEMASRHFFEVIEGHDGTLSYHFDKMRDLFFDINKVYLLFLLAIPFFIFKDKKINIDRISILALVLIVFAFFTLAKTKMPAFTFMVAPLLLIILASFIDDVWNFISNLKIKYASITATLISVFVIGVLSVKGFRKNQLYEQHSDHSENHYRWARTKNAKLYRTLSASNKTIVFNTPPDESAMVMFYTDATAYPYIPDSTVCADLINRGYDVSVYNKIDLPEFVRNNEKIRIITPSVWD